MPPKRSNVWKHFVCEDNKTARCTHCSKPIRYSGNTTNLNNHLERKHKNALSSKLYELNHPADRAPDPAPTASICFERYKQSPGTSTAHDQTVSVESTVNYLVNFSSERQELRTVPKNQPFDETGSYNQHNDITEALLYMIARDALPFASVDKDGFKYFLSKLEPSYPIPSRETLTRIMDDKYKDLSGIVKNRFSGVSDFVLTTDIWTENTISYLALTANFLSKPDWKIQSVNIGVFQFIESHSAYYIKENILKICSEWNISFNKVVMVVTDNSCNIATAVTDIFGVEKHLSCFAHAINAIPIQAIDLSNETIKQVIKKIKDIVAFTKRFVSASDELRRIQVSHGNSECAIFDLLQEVPKRWNTTYHMINRFMVLSDTVSSMLLTFPKSPPMLTAYELEISKQITILLKPLQDVTVELSKSAYVTCSNVIPLVNCMIRAIDNYIPSTEPVMDLKRNILTEIEKRFKNMEIVKPLAISTILDPRYKKLHFKNQVALCSALQSISAAIVEEKEADVKFLVPMETTDVDSIWWYHDALVSSESEPFVSANDEPLELKYYLQHRHLDRAEDPLIFWKNAELIYPNLSKMAFKFLPIAATSLPPERLFTEAGDYVDQARNGISLERLSSLLFLGSLTVEQWKGAIS